MFDWLDVCSFFLNFWQIWKMKVVSKVKLENKNKQKIK